jgi:phosphoribosyl 1,2-cyclic phosphodiesterase
VELLAEGRRLVLDAGTGIMGLGKSMAQAGQNGSDTPKEATLLLTHFHWDHIQGLPFFAPLYDPAFKILIAAPKQDRGDVEAMIRKVMGPVYFPIPWEALEADLTFQDLNEGNWSDHGLSVNATRMRHTDFTVGYRIETASSRIVYIPDNELVGGDFPTPPDWRRRIVEFVSDADLLIHDGMFTDEEYAVRAGWGHSTAEQCLDLAVEAGVKHLHFFHHSPERTDDALDRLLDRMKEMALAQSTDLNLEAAAEGMTLRLR